MTTKQTKRLRISIIGGGRMGTALGHALRAAGHRIQLVVARRSSAARQAAQVIGGDATPVSARDLVKAPETLAQSDLLLISTPDDLIQQVAKDLVRVAKNHPRTPRRVALHTSGALSSEALRPLTTAGYAVGSFHPLVSIADAGAGPEIFEAVHFCLEGQSAAVQVARSLVRDLGGHPFVIASDAKPLYHAAAAISSGHVVALFDLAIEMLVTCGLSKQRAQQVLVPLLKSTAASLTAKSPAQALTGPLARGDLGTTRKHLTAMKANKLNEATAIYSALGLRAVRLAMTTRRDRNSLKEIAKLLSR